MQVTSKVTTTPAAAVELLEFGDLRIELERRGSGPPLLLLGSEEAWERDLPLVEALAREYEVFLPSPPGFGRSNRPDWVSSPDDISYVMLDLVERFKLRDAVVLGFSLGGWIAAEMATKDDSFISKLVLVDAFGIKPGGPFDRDVADIYMLTAAQVAKLKWHDPEKGKRDFPSWSEDALTIVARNNESFARFCWEPYMHNPKLVKRLHRIAVPTLLIWGAQDGFVTPAYGEAYRKLIPQARLDLIPFAGHFPHVEQPNAFERSLRAFLES